LPNPPAAGLSRKKGFFDESGKTGVADVAFLV